MKLVLENGQELFNFKGYNEIETVSQVAVSNSVVGYQEIITNPDYFNKLVIMSFPLIGNYGLNDEDDESKKLTINGLIVGDYNDKPSNFRYTKTLLEVFNDDEKALAGFEDTRYLIDYIKENKIDYVALVHDDCSKDEALSKIEKVKNAEVRYELTKRKIYSRCANYQYTIAMIDLGYNRSLINSLKELNVNAIIVPHTYDLSKIEALNVDGIIVSSGPFNKTVMEEAKPLLQSLWGYKPMIGMGFGYLALAYSRGYDIKEFKEDYFGSSHPIQCVLDQKVYSYLKAYDHIVDYNHEDLKVSHKDLVTNVVSGLYDKENKVYAYAFDIATNSAKQYFNQFIDLMKENKNA